MIQDASSMDRPVDKPGGLTRTHWVLVGITLVALIAAVVLLPSIRRWSRSETSVDISRIRIATVERGDLIRETSAQGTIIAAFHPTLFSPATGIAKLSVKAGQQVAVGHPLGTVESPELRSRLEQERSILLSLQADVERQRILAQQSELQNRQQVGLRELELEAARRALARAERSRREGILNEVDYEAARDAVEVADLRLELARDEARFGVESLNFELQNRQSRVDRQRLIVSDLERQVEDLTIRSPVAGLVSRLDVDDQDAVTRGQSLVRVVDLSAFEVEIAVSENYADEIGPGTESVVTYDGAEYRGEVKSVSPEVEGARVRGRVAFVGQAPEGLKQNQRVATRLILETRADVLKVQRGPFLEAGGGRQAYLVEDGLAILGPIEVGSLSVSEVEIVSGLEAGDSIIISDTSRFDGANTVLLRR